ncbi:MAG: response regulator [Gammaproteobacteria bacterium]|nr:response regulator [Gammaproteobacteria bacterium]MDH5799460.1 response regulator [Gammaproteobacteria bacterium]
MKVLIVDDIPENLYILNSLLQTKGYQVIEATDGRDALAKARLTPPDLVISDILMPVMDGFILCHTWKNSDTLKQTPFIFYTATYTDDKDRSLALGMGADAFITKPCSFQKLLDTIEKVTHADCQKAAKSTLDERDYYKKYNTRLINKLEHKLAELEIKNKALQKKELELMEVNRHMDKSMAETTRELIRANQESQSFSYTISHDLRAPLRSIDGFSAALLEDCSEQLGDNGRHYLQRIRFNVNTMSAMIDGLLLLSRVNHTDLSPEPVNLAQMAQEIIARLCQQQPHRKVDIDISPDLFAQGDRRLIHILLESLINNAWKYTKHTQQAQIEFKKIADKDKNKLVYYIKDNGIGFDPRYTQKLFDAFQKGHRDREFDGTGIGLTTAQRIVQRHGGNIWAEAQDGEGATIYFCLN